MENEELYEIDLDDGEEGLAPGSRLSVEDQLLGRESSVSMQMRRFEDLANGGDPFAATASEARRMGERFRDLGGENVGSWGIGSAAAESMGAISQRLRMPLGSDPGRLELPHQRSSGFIVRPGVGDYNRFFQSSGPIQAVSFQFQQADVVRTALNRPDTELITQRLTYQSSQPDAREDRITASILAPNELTIRAANTRFEDGEWQSDTEANVYGLKFPYAFHMKMGASDDLAYISTQNLTSPLSRNSTFETMLMLRRQAGPNASKARLEEQELGDEISIFMKELSSKARGWHQQANAGEAMRGGYANLAKGSIYHRKNLFINKEIAPMMGRVFEEVRKTGDTMVMSMGEIGLLMDGEGEEAALLQSGTAQKLKQSIYGLLDSNQLRIVTDQRRLWTVMDERRELQALSAQKTFTSRQRERRAELEKKGKVNEAFMRAFKAGQITTGGFGFHHDKSFAVFDPTGQVKVLQTGSANLTKMSLVPLAERSSYERRRVFESLGFTKDEINWGMALDATTLKQELGQTQQDRGKQEILDVLMTPNSAESVMMLASGTYFRAISDEYPKFGDRSEFLASLNQNNALTRTFNLAAGRSRSGNIFYGQGAENALDSRGQAQLIELETRLKAMSEQTGSLLQVSGRYKAQGGEMMLMGLQVNFDPAVTKGPRTTLELTSNNQGGIVFTSQNRIVTGSVLINRENEAVSIDLGGKTIRLGSPTQKGVRTSVELDAIDTTLMAVASVGRRLQDQAMREVPRRWWEGLNRTRGGMQAQLSGAQRSALKGEFARSIYAAGARTVFSTEAANAPLEVLINRLTEIDEADGLGVIRDARKIMAQGILTSGSFSAAERQQRNSILDDIFSSIGKGQVDLAVDVMATFFSGRELMFEDLFQSMYETAAQKDPFLQQMIRDSGRAAVKSITDAFLPTNQLGYSGMQAKYRRPVMEIDLPLRDSSRAADVLSNLGVMAPGRFGAATKLDDLYIRLMGSNAHTNYANMPASGAYRTVVAEDREMNVGATAVYSKQLFRSLSGLAAISRKELAEQMSSFNVSWGDVEWQNRKDQIKRWKDSIGEDEDSLVIWSAYSALRPEQLPQRFKNLLGTRSVFDLSKEASEYITTLGMSGSQPLVMEEMLSGRLRPNMPQEQYEEFKRVRAEIKAGQPRLTEAALTEEVTRYFRKEEIGVNATDRGFIGGQQARRTAISLGASFLGDFNYANPDYVQGQGMPANLSVRFNSASVNSVPDTIERLSDVMAVDSFLVMQATSIDIGGESKKFQPGLYQKDEEGLRLVATYDEEGYFHVAESFRKSGKYDVLESIMLKTPSFSRRHQRDAITYIPSGSLAVSQQNTRYKVEMRGMTFMQPDSTFRPGQDPGKGPMDFRDAEFFRSFGDYIGKKFAGEAGDTNNSLYGIMSPSTMKGYRFNTGAEIFSQADLRADAMAVVQSDIKTVAASLAFAFAGGSEDAGGALKQSLRTYLDDRIAAETDPEAAGRLRQTRQILSKRDLGLKGIRGMEAGLAMPGLITLGGRISAGAMDERFKTFSDILVRTIGGDAAAAAELQSGITAMMDLALANSTRTSQGQIASQGDVRVYSAVGFLEMLHSGSEVLGSNFKVKQQNIGRKEADGTYSGRSFDDLGRYKNDLMHRQVTKQMAGVLGIDLDSGLGEDELRKQLSFIQSRVDSMFVLEGLQEHMPSSSLVTMGGQREIDVEFQNIMSMHGLGVNAFYKEPGADGRELSQHERARRAFAVLVNMRLSGAVDYGSDRVSQTTLLFGVDETGRRNMERLALSRQAATILLPGFNDKQLFEAIDVDTSSGRFNAEAGSAWRSAENQFVVLQQAGTFQDPATATMLRASLASVMPGTLSMFAPLEGSGYTSKVQLPTALAEQDKALDDYVNAKLGTNAARQEAITTAFVATLKSFNQQTGKSFGEYLSFVAKTATGNEQGDRRLLVGFAQLLEEKEFLKRGFVNIYGNLKSLSQGEDEPRLNMTKIDFHTGGEMAKDQARRFVSESIDYASEKSIGFMGRLQKTRGKLYLEGMRALAQSKTNLATEARRSYEVVLPRMSFEQGADGMVLRFDSDLNNAVRGFVAGYDVLEQMSLTYTGGAQHVFLDNQVAIADLISMINELDPERIRGGFLNAAGQELMAGKRLTLSYDQAQLLGELQEKLLRTQSDVTEYVSTKMQNRVSGNAVESGGVTGFPTSDILVNPDEVVVGSGYSRGSYLKESRDTFDDITSSLAIQYASVASDPTRDQAYLAAFEGLQAEIDLMRDSLNHVDSKGRSPATRRSLGNLDVQLRELQADRVGRPGITQLTDAQSAERTANIRRAYAARRVVSTQDAEQIDDPIRRAAYEAAHLSTEPVQMIYRRNPVMDSPALERANRTQHERNLVAAYERGQYQTDPTQSRLDATHEISVYVKGNFLDRVYTDNAFTHDLTHVLTGASFMDSDFSDRGEVLALKLENEVLGANNAVVNADDFLNNPTLSRLVSFQKDLFTQSVMNNRTGGVIPDGGFSIYFDPNKGTVEYWQGTETYEERQLRSQGIFSLEQRLSPYQILAQTGGVERPTVELLAAELAMLRNFGRPDEALPGYESVLSLENTLSEVVAEGLTPQSSRSLAAGLKSALAQAAATGRTGSVAQANLAFRDGRAEIVFKGQGPAAELDRLHVDSMRVIAAAQGAMGLGFNAATSAFVEGLSGTVGGAREIVARASAGAEVEQNGVRYGQIEDYAIDVLRGDRAYNRLSYEQQTSPNAAKALARLRNTDDIVNIRFGKSSVGFARVQAAGQTLRADNVFVEGSLDYAGQEAVLITTLAQEATSRGLSGFDVEVDESLGQRLKYHFGADVSTAGGVTTASFNTSRTAELSAQQAKAYQRLDIRQQALANLAAGDENYQILAKSLINRGYSIIVDPTYKGGKAALDENVIILRDRSAGRLAHEATHVLQKEVATKQGLYGFAPLGLSDAAMGKASDKVAAYDTVSARIEQEAYFLENNPKLVIQLLQQDAHLKRQQTGSRVSPFDAEQLERRQGKYTYVTDASRVKRVQDGKTYVQVPEIAITEQDKSIDSQLEGLRLATRKAYHGKLEEHADRYQMASREVRRWQDKGVTDTGTIELYSATYPSVVYHVEPYESGQTRPVINYMVTDDLVDGDGMIREKIGERYLSNRIPEVAIVETRLDAKTGVTERISRGVLNLVGLATIKQVRPAVFKSEQVLEAMSSRNRKHAVLDATVGLAIQTAKLTGTDITIDRYQEGAFYQPYEDRIFAGNFDPSFIAHEVYHSLQSAVFGEAGRGTGLGFPSAGAQEHIRNLYDPSDWLIEMEAWRITEDPEIFQKIIENKGIPYEYTREYQIEQLGQSDPLDAHVLRGQELAVFNTRLGMLLDGKELPPAAERMTRATSQTQRTMSIVDAESIDDDTHILPENFLRSRIEEDGAIPQNFAAYLDLTKRQLGLIQQENQMVGLDDFAMDSATHTRMRLNMLSALTEQGADGQFYGEKLGLGTIVGRIAPEVIAETQPTPPPTRRVDAYDGSQQPSPVSPRVSEAYSDVKGFAARERLRQRLDDKSVPIAALDAEGYGAASELRAFKLEESEAERVNRFLSESTIQDRMASDLAAAAVSGRLNTVQADSLRVTLTRSAASLDNKPATERQSSPDPFGPVINQLDGGSDPATVLGMYSQAEQQWADEAISRLMAGQPVLGSTPTAINRKLNAIEAKLYALTAINSQDGLAGQLGFEQGPKYNFAEAQQAAAQAGGDLNSFMRQTYGEQVDFAESLVAGSQDGSNELQKRRQDILARLYRGGIPLGMAMANDPVTKVIDFNTVRSRSKPGMNRPAANRNRSSMVLPAQGMWFMGGGDVDGDAYQIVSSAVEQMQMAYNRRAVELRRSSAQEELTPDQINEEVQQLNIMRQDIEKERGVLMSMSQGRGLKEVDLWRSAVQANGNNALLSTGQALGLSDGEAVERYLQAEGAKLQMDPLDITAAIQLEMQRQKFKQLINGENISGFDAGRLDLVAAQQSAEERSRFGDGSDFMQGWLGMDASVVDLFSPAELMAASNIQRAPMAHFDGTENANALAYQQAQKTEQLLSLINADDDLRGRWSKDYDSGFIDSVVAKGADPNWTGPTDRDAIERSLGLVYNYTGQNYASVDRGILGDVIGSGLVQDSAGIYASQEASYTELQKLYTKGLGDFESEAQINALQGVIGTAGGKLLGPIYNLITPMTMNVMGEYSFSRALGFDDFKAQVETSLGEIDADNPLREAADAFFTKMSTGQLQEETQQRFNNSRFLSASIQQLMRDAIKAKKGGDLSDQILQDFEYGGEQRSLDQHLEAAGDDAERADIYERFVSGNLGADLGDSYNGMTSLGALTALYRYTSTDDAGMEDFVSEAGQRYGLGMGVSQDSLEERIAGSLVETVVQYRSSGQRQLDFDKQAQGLSFIYGGEDQAFYRSRMGDEKYDARRALFVQTQAEHYNASDDDRNRLTVEAFIRQDVVESGVMTADTVRQMRDLAQYRREAKVDPTNAYHQHAQQSELIQQQAGTVMLSLMQREGQLGPNALMAGMYGLTGAFMTAQAGAYDAYGGEAVIGDYTQTGAGIFASGGGNTAEQQLMARLFANKEIQESLGQATQGFGAMYSIANEIVGVQKELTEHDGLSPNGRTAELQDRLQTLITQQATALQSDTTTQFQSILRQSVDIDEGVKSQDLSAALDLLTRNETAAEFQQSELTQKRHSVSTGMELFVGPMLMSFLGSDAELDERFGLFAVDAVQGFAMTSTFQNEELRQAVNTRQAKEPGWKPSAEVKRELDAPQKNIEHMRRGRIRGMIAQAETPVHGIFQAMLQESLIATTGQLANVASEQITSAMHRADPNGVLGSGLAKGITEAFSALAVMSVSRSAAANIAQAKHKPPDFVERMLRNFAEQIWQAVEQVQLFLNSPEGQMIDENTGELLDFEYEAFPGLVAEGLETGLIVIDENNNEISSTGDDPLAAGMFETIQTARNQAEFGA